MAKTKIIKINPTAPDGKAIQFAAALLRDGGLVAFPTETVYGIGANFLDKAAIDRLYRIKKRPITKPFTIHISDINMIGDMHCEISDLADRLIKQFWPGPLTIILKAKSACLLASRRSRGPGRQDKLGFRMPSNTVAKELISASGVPVACPSANISGENPPSEAGEVSQNLYGEIDLILDGGKTKFGRESTIVDVSVLPYKILREGAVSKDDIERIADSAVGGSAFGRSV